MAWTGGWRTSRRTAGVQLLTKDLNELYASTPALYERDNEPGGFQWINGGDADRNVLTFIRWDTDGNPLVCAINFSGGPHTDYPLGVPVPGAWQEVLNTDAAAYGGSGVLNERRPDSDGRRAMDGQPATLTVTLPPLGAAYFKPLARLQRPGVTASAGASKARNPCDSGLFAPRRWTRRPALSSSAKVVVEFISALLPGVDRPARPQMPQARVSRDRRFD